MGTARLMLGLGLLLLVGRCGDTILNVNEITSPSGDRTAIVDQIVVTPALVETVNGQRFTVTAQAYAGSLPLSGIPILWATSDPAVANIETPTSATITVKAEGPGEAELIARSGSAEGRAKVKVRPAS